MGYTGKKHKTIDISKSNDLDIEGNVVMNEITKFDNMPNPGLTPNQRITTTGIAALGSMLGGLFMNFDTQFMMSEYWAPVIFTGLIGVGTWFLFPRRMNQFELAIMEFKDLGLTAEVIGSVIVENRSKVYDLLAKSEIINSTANKKLIREIAYEAMSIIAGFRDDPTDVSRSRVTLNRCLNQTLKIVDNYATVEKRKNVMDKKEFVDLAVLTEEGLIQIKEALVEQHRRNLDNNQMALEVDLEVSDQLLGKFTATRL